MPPWPVRQDALPSPLVRRPDASRAKPSIGAVSPPPRRRRSGAVRRRVEEWTEPLAEGLERSEATAMPGMGGVPLNGERAHDVAGIEGGAVVKADSGPQRARPDIQIVVRAASLGQGRCGRRIGAAEAIQALEDLGAHAARRRPSRRRSTDPRARSLPSTRTDRDRRASRRPTVRCSWPTRRSR